MSIAIFFNILRICSSILKKSVEIVALFKTSWNVSSFTQFVGSFHCLNFDKFRDRAPLNLIFFFYSTESFQLRSDCSLFLFWFSDCWNRFDVASLVIYFIILILRIATWVAAGSVANNRTLVIAGYLYSFNTLCLTLRAFGQVMEQQKDVGTIQIALFSILRDVRTVLWQFLAVILAFSIAITKIYMSERSFIANKSERHEM